MRILRATLLSFVLASTTLTACGGGGSDPVRDGEEGKADLIPRKIEGEPFYYHQASRTSVGHRVQVVNQGDADAPASTVLVTYSTFDGPRTMMVMIPALAAGAASDPIYTELPDDTTTSRYRVTVDAGETIDEHDESNNEAEEEVLF